MDEDGYPNEEELEVIRQWKITGTPSLYKAFDYIQGLWLYDDYFRKRKKFQPIRFFKDLWRWLRDYFKSTHGNTYDVDTGGWSGNEDIIKAMCENYILWSLTWESTRTGGHYVFEIPEIKE